MKSMLHRGISLLLCVMLLLQMVPAVSVHVHAEETLRFTPAPDGYTLTEETAYLLVVPDENGTPYYAVAAASAAVNVQTIANYYTDDRAFEIPKTETGSIAMTYGSVANVEGALGLTFGNGRLLYVTNSRLVATTPTASTKVPTVRWESSGGMGSLCFTTDEGTSYYLDATVDEASGVSFGLQESSTSSCYLYMVCNHNREGRVTHYPRSGDCTTGGRLEYWICEDCQGMFLDADCTVPGTLDDVQYNGHIFGEGPSEYIDETYHERYCTVCKTYVQQEHVLEYESMGRYHYGYCATCDGNVVVEKHEYVMEYRTALCEATSVAVGTCSLEACGDVIRLEIPATGHNWSPWYTAQEPTDVDSGYQMRYCLNKDCGKTERRQIPSLTHQHQLTPVEKVPATCAATGTKAHFICGANGTTEATSGCGCMYLDADGTQQVSQSELVIPVQSHNMGEWVYLNEKTQPTETTPGTQQRSCTECDFFEDRVIPALNHTAHKASKVEANEATCVRDGNIEYYICDIPQYDDSGKLLSEPCGVLFRDEACTERLDPDEQIIPATGHSMSAWETRDEGHIRYCENDCGYQEAASHVTSLYAPNGDDPDVCQWICLSCGAPVVSGKGHEVTYTPCADDENCHEGTCSQCGSTFTLEHSWAMKDDTSGLHYCKDCGINRDADDHIWIAHETNTPASCKQEGSQSYYCAAEGCQGTRTETIPKTAHTDENDDYFCDACGENLCVNGHQPQIIPAVPATCTKAGMSEGSECANCGTVLEEPQPTELAPHTEEVIPGTPASCTETGLTDGVKCSVCDAVLTEQQTIPAVDHKDEGNDYFCDVCGTNLCGDNHVSQVIPAVPATCTKAGMSEGSECANCGKVLEEPQPTELAPHTEEVIPAVPSTCTTAGTTAGVKCSACDAVLEEPQPTELAPHTEEVIPAVPSTCTTAGTTAGVKCSVCDAVLEEPQPTELAPHTEEVIPAVPSTCTTAGTTEGVKCSACDAVLKEPQPTELAEHIPEAIPAVSATCAKAGLTEGEKCATCGVTLKEQTETPKIAHTLETIAAKAPTCTENGKTAGEWCTACGLVMVVSTELPATGHRWSEWYVSKEATHTQNGYWLRCCLEDCGTFDESPYPGRGHEHPQLKWEEEIPATCNQQGRKGYWYCMDVTTNSQEVDEADFAQGCEAMFLDAEGTQLVTVEDLIIPATGEHQMGEWKASAENNDDSEFINEERSCTCGYIEYRSTPRETHVHNLIYLEASEPSCLVNGAKARYACTGCPCLFEDAEGQVRMKESDQVIPATGHDYGNWIATDSGHQRQCSLCEELQIKEGHSESPAPGDITGETCSLMCMICRNQAVMDDHLYSEISACDDRWQHQQTCSRCTFALVEDHEFGPWQYGKFTNENTGDRVTGHYRTCECGAMETSVEHLWDKGEEQKPGFMTYRCTVEGCEAEKVDFLRCMHTCADCGNCTAETPCPGKEPCDCTQPEPLQLTEPTFLTNDTEDPNQTYLGDILVKDQDEALDPNAKPGQEIPEEYAGFTVGIQEVPISDEETGEIISNPYTDYVEQALTGYATKHLFDIHLLDKQGQVAESTGDAQYLIRLCLEEETVLALQKGLLRLAHITERGTFFYGVDEDCTPFYKLEDTQAWFWADKFSPFALVEPEAPYFGREALATLANKDALLYAYDQIVMGVETCQDKITIYPVWQAPSLTIAELQMVMDAYTRDHTEHFWLKTKYSISYKKSSGLASAVKPQYSMTGDELAEARARFDAEVEEVLHGITPEMSEFDRQLLVHDRLAARVTYEGSSDYAHDAYGALVEGKAVCQGYAEAFQYLLRRVDIQSFIVTGVGINDEGEIPHAWNLVRIDNKYYHTDLTWDDADDRPYHAYFNMDDHFITEDHAIAITAYPMKECVELEANYFTVKKTDLSDSQACNAGVVADKLTGAVNGVSFLLTEKTSPATFLTWFMSQKSNIFSDANLTNVSDIHYTYNGREAMISFLAENGEPPHVCGNGAVVSGQTAICTTPGWADYYQCSCGKLFTEQACTHEITNLAAWKLGDGKTTAGHSYGSLKDGQPAIHTSSQLQDGMASYYQCAHCGEYFTEDLLHTTWNSLILKAAHQYGDWVTDASGHQRSCTCGHTADDGAHTYLDQYDVNCDTCGYERTVVLPEIAVIRPSINTETGKMTVTLIGENPLSGKMMVAVYDLNGRMLGISYADKTLNVDKTGKTFTIVFDKSGTPRLVKAFIFDSSFVPTMVIDSIELIP